MIKLFFHIWSEVNCEDIVQEIYSFMPPELRECVIESRERKEIDTINKIWKAAQEEDFYCGYVHTNGAYNRNSCIDDLRKYMCHFNLTNYKNCVEALESVDCCGVDYRTEPQRHFSGNYWWANSKHLRTLPKPDDIISTLTERHKCEFWACYSEDVRTKSFFDSGVNVYERHLYKYPKENYIGKSDEKIDYI